MTESSSNVASTGMVGVTSYADLETLRRPCRHLMGGTATVRRHAGEYLPQLPGEATPEYSERLMGAVVRPWFPDAVDELVGKPFSAEIQLGPDVPVFIRGQAAGDGSEAVEGWAEDCDLAGNNFHTFCRNGFLQAVAEGGGAIVVDHQKNDLPDNPSQDDMKKAGRAYLVHLHPEDILEAEPIAINGRKVLPRLRWKTYRTEAIGEWGRRRVEQVRVLTRGTPADPATGAPAQFCRYDVYEKNDKGEWMAAPVESGVLSPHVEIPAEPYIEWGYKPPLSDLADLVYEDWREEIHLATYRRAVMRLTAVTKGIPGDKVAECFRYVAGFRILVVEAPDKEGRGGVATWKDAEFALHETSGAAAAVWAIERDKRHEAIRMASKRPLLPDKTQTLGEKRIDTAGAHASLRDMVLRFKDRMEAVLMHWAAYRGEASGGSIIFAKDYLEQGPEQVAVDTVKEVRAQGDLSRRTTWRLLKELGALPEFDEKAEEQALAEEAAAAEAREREALRLSARDLLDTGRTAELEREDDQDGAN